MYRKLNETERQWLNKLLAVDFKGKEILQRQISEAKVSFQQEYAFISIKFVLEDVAEKYPYRERVPVEMHVFQKESAPIVFLLHVIGGVVNELEIFPADSSRLDLESIDVQCVEYEIAPTVKL